MSEQFLAEMRWAAFNFPPKHWAFCNGELLPINQNQALFALLGTNYGGNGQTNFALPNLQGRVPIHEGNGHTLGEAAGASSVTLTQQQMPQHLHLLQATTATGDSQSGAGNLLATVPGRLYTDPASLATLSPVSVGNAGGSQPHSNMMPYLVLNCFIALSGIFPSQT